MIKIKFIYFSFFFSCFLACPLFAEPNLQEKIWLCEDTAIHLSECDGLKAQLRQILTQGEFKEVEKDSLIREASTANIKKLQFAEDLFAVFKPENPNLEDLTEKARAWHRDVSYTHEIAVYIMSEIYGFGVPMTVERVIHGKRGALIVYVKNAGWAFPDSPTGADADFRVSTAIDSTGQPESTLLLTYTRRSAVQGKCKVTPRELRQFRRMRVLDFMLKNWDRYYRNWLYQASTHRVVPIDHGNCFNYGNTYNYHGNPTLEEVVGYLKEDPELAEAIRFTSAQDLVKRLSGLVEDTKLSGLSSRIEQLRSLAL